MEVFLFSLFSAIIIFITVFSMIKVFNIAYRREEITLRKYRIYATSSLVAGLCLTGILPFGYQFIIDVLL